MKKILILVILLCTPSQAATLQFNLAPKVEIQIEERLKLTLFIFGTPDCSPCVWMRQNVLPSLQKEEYEVYYIDVSKEENKKYLSKYNISTLPLLLMCRDKVIFDKYVGSLTLNSIKDWFTLTRNNKRKFLIKTQNGVTVRGRSGTYYNVPQQQYYSQRCGSRW